MKRLFLLLGLTFFCGTIWATHQIPDRLIHEGTTYYLHNHPLEVYFKKHPKKRPEGDVGSTALWRGYIATFEIQNNKLILKDIEIQAWLHEEGKEEWGPSVKLKSVLKDVFPETSSLVIDWCTDILILPHGRLKNYVKKGTSSVDEQYLLLVIQDGNLTESKEFNGIELKAFKKAQLGFFKGSKDYLKLAEKWKEKYEYTTVEIDAYLEESILEYITTFLTE